MAAPPEELIFDGGKYFSCINIEQPNEAYK